MAHMSTRRGRLVLLTAILASLGLAPALFAQSPAAGAILFLTSSPLRATVFLDGTPLPALTPLLLRDVPVGPHTLLVRKAGYVDARMDVILAAGERRPVSVRSEERRVGKECTG
jgi:hypothetical protein